MTLKTYYKLRVLFGLFLLVMILARMVWIPLRQHLVSFPPRALFSLELLSLTRGDVCTVPETFPTRWPEGFRNRGTEPVSNHLRWLDSAGFRWFAGSACRGGRFQSEILVRRNERLLLGAVLGVVTFVRIFSGSWLLGLVAALILLSRGRLISGVGRLSLDMLALFILPFWAAAQAHFQRSASPIMQGMLYVFILLAGVVDSSLVGLSLTMPAFILVGYLLVRDKTYHQPPEDNGREKGPLQTFWYLVGVVPHPELRRKRHPVPDWGRGGLLRHLEVPFFFWLKKTRRFRRTMWIAVVSFVVMIGGLVLWMQTRPGTTPLFDVLPHLKFRISGDSGLFTWISTWHNPVDLDLSVAFGLIFVCMFIPPAGGITEFRRICFSVLTGLLGVTIMAWFFDMLDAAYFEHAGIFEEGRFLGEWGRAGDVLIWFEPLILTLGALAIYHIGRILLKRFAVFTR